MAYVVKMGSRFFKFDRLPEDMIGTPAVDIDTMAGLDLPFGWKAEWGRLWDCRSEVRPVGSPEEILEVCRFSSWPEYDRAMMEKKAADLEEKVCRLEGQLDLFVRESERLYLTLRKIGDINQQGGPGSRRAVTRILAEAGITPCQDCGTYNCVCADAE
jgi:hypothetical protein